MAANNAPKKGKRDTPKRPFHAKGHNPSQGKYRDEFREKNARRRDAKKRSGSAYRTGRATRREYAPIGAFGKVAADTYNLCVSGTQGNRMPTGKKGHAHEE